MLFFLMQLLSSLSHSAKCLIIEGCELLCATELLGPERQFLFDGDLMLKFQFLKIIAGILGLLYLLLTDATTGSLGSILDSIAVNNTILRRLLSGYLQPELFTGTLIRATSRCNKLLRLFTADLHLLTHTLTRGSK